MCVEKLPLHIIARQQTQLVHLVTFLNFLNLIRSSISTMVHFSSSYNFAIVLHNHQLIETKNNESYFAHFIVFGLKRIKEWNLSLLLNSFCTPKNFSFKLERYAIVLLIWACEYYVLCHKSLYGREINFSLLELRNLPTRQLFSPWTYNKRRSINKRK